MISLVLSGDSNDDKPRPRVRGCFGCHRCRGRWAALEIGTIGNQRQVQQSISIEITKTKTTRLDLFLLMPRLQVGGCPTGWTSSTTSSLLRTIYCYRFQSFSSRFTIHCVLIEDLKRLLYQNLGRGSFFPGGKVQLSEAEKHHVGV